MRLETNRPIRRMAWLACCVLAGCSGSSGGGSNVTTTALQHPFFPSTVGDTWTWEWRDVGTGLITGSETETVTAVQGNTVTIRDDEGEDAFYEIKQDPQGRVYVVATGDTESTLSPPVVVIPPDNSAGAIYMGGPFDLTIAGFGSYPCSGYWIETFHEAARTVPAGTFVDLVGFHTESSWPDGAGGQFLVEGDAICVAGVGLVFRTVVEFDVDTGPTGMAWEVSLVSYDVQ